MKDNSNKLTTVCEPTSSEINFIYTFTLYCKVRTIDNLTLKYNRLLSLKDDTQVANAIQ